MAKYRKKPVVIEAFQFYDNQDENTNAYPRWLVKAFVDGIIYGTKAENTFIKTLEGDHLVSDGDFIIQGVKGELYPCKPDIFEMTYEKVEE